MSPQEPTTFRCCWNCRARATQIHLPQSKREDSHQSPPRDLAPTPAQPTGFNDDTLLDNIAWFNGNSGGQTHAVGGKFANGFGLHDMSGNVWEWTQEWSAANSSPRETNPKAPSFATVRMLRGGGWSTDASNCRASRRIGVMSNVATHYTGFRVARNP